ncbi:EF-hand domain-containing protein [Cochlodiniinecator piscidefendens]|uniref:EF-hand domain-containing protein n=1 Tax=Cochlodiniinecator piscidefendens TaxID=2715756 RepID=UPI0014073A4F|nr:EF-hand domain-containing protein [Cochlodiniinecator piscidefendens]
MSKKTETIEVRLSPELKAELAKLGQERDQPMSAIVRDLVTRELGGANDPKHKGIVAMAKSTGTLRAGALATAIVLGLGVSLNAVTLSTATASEDIREMFTEADANNDGTVTRAEFDAFLMADVMDEEEEHDDIPAICHADFERLEAQDAAMVDDDFSNELTAFFGEMDGNGDGVLNFDEVWSAMQSEAQNEFNELDANNDLRVTQDEFNAALTNDAELTTFTAQLTPDCSSALMAEISYELTEEFAELDVSRDGAISLPEFMAN